MSASVQPQVARWVRTGPVISVSRADRHGEHAQHAAQFLPGDEHVVDAFLGFDFQRFHDLAINGEVIEIKLGGGDPIVDRFHRMVPSSVIKIPMMAERGAAGNPGQAWAGSTPEGRPQ